MIQNKFLKYIDNVKGKIDLPAALGNAEYHLKLTSWSDGSIDSEVRNVKVASWIEPSEVFVKINGEYVSIEQFIKDNWGWWIR